MNDRILSEGQKHPAPTFEAATKPSYVLWACAFVLAICIHGAAAAIIAQKLSAEDVDDELGAPAMEVGIEMTAPHEEETDLPPGPVSEASTYSPAVVAQQANEKESDLPKAQPMETEDPDQIVSPDASKKPDDKDPIVKTVNAAPSAESIASEDTAPPSSETIPEGPRSVAPQQGTGQSNQKIKATWQKELVAHLDRHKRYPAGETQQSAEIVVSFTLDRLGHVLSASIAKSSGNAAFDEAAIAMVRRSDPVPQPPAALADMTLSFTVPVIFRIKGHS